MSSYPIINNEEMQRFEVQLEGEVATLEYELHNGTIVLVHTEVPEKMEGKGIASALATHAFELARELGRKVKVYCPFVSTYVKRHKEYNDLLVS